MTAAVPDPPICQGLSQCVNALGRHDRRCSAAEIRARAAALAQPTDGLRELRTAMIAALPGVHPWGDAVDRLLSGPLAPLLNFAAWVVSLDDDDPNSPGRIDRRTVTLNEICTRARHALDAS